MSAEAAPNDSCCGTPQTKCCSGLCCPTCNKLCFSTGLLVIVPGARHQTAWLAVDWVKWLEHGKSMGWPDIHWLARDLWWAGGSHCVSLEQELEYAVGA